MRKILFETPQPDELAGLHETYWRDELNSLSVPVLDADEDETGIALTLSAYLPYRAETDRYTEHVRNCPTCLNTPVWDIGCETGARLAHFAADACAAQEDTAAQN